MTTHWESLRNMDVDALAEYGSARDDPFDVQSVNVAFQRLQTKAMQDAAAAQVDAALAAACAARAAEDTAGCSKDPPAKANLWQRNYDCQRCGRFIFSDTLKDGPLNGFSAFNP
jgi:hypothetical protein